MRLINVSNFLKQFSDQVPGDKIDAIELRLALLNEPTVEAVEVVRCKDCKWWKTNYMWNGSERKVCVIDAYEPVRNENDYCSRGKRK